jgi:hypothetical protein
MTGVRTNWLASVDGFDDPEAISDVFLSEIGKYPNYWCLNRWCVLLACFSLTFTKIRNSFGRRSSALPAETIHQLILAASSGGGGISYYLVAARKNDGLIDPSLTIYLFPTSKLCIDVRAFYFRSTSFFSLSCTQPCHPSSAQPACIPVVGYRMMDLLLHVVMHADAAWPDL